MILSSVIDDENDVTVSCYTFHHAAHLFNLIGTVESSGMLIPLIPSLLQVANEFSDHCAIFSLDLWPSLFALILPQFSSNQGP